MKNLLFGFLVLSTMFGITACIPEVAYRDISEFQFNPSALDNTEEIELLYASATPTNEEHLTYFVHAVGISTTSGDTVNVLTTFNRGAGGGSSKNVFKYFTLDSEEGKNYFEKMYNDPEAERQYDFSAIADITRVTYDKRFDYVAKNTYPTVIGFLEK